MLYENTADHRRLWPWLAHPDGHTLELDPGEQVELDGQVDDAWLKPVNGPSPQPPPPPLPAPAVDETKE